MTVNLNIGPEEENIFTRESERLPKSSKHVLNLKSTDKDKKMAAREHVSVDLKEEIKAKNSVPGRICIVGELPRAKQGLGRAPMIIAALLMIVLLNMGQVLFLGKKEGSETLALAGEAFLSLQGAGQSIFSDSDEDDLFLFNQAETLFQEAESRSSFLIDHVSPWLTEPKDAASLRNLLDAGELMAEIGQHISNTKSALFNPPEEDSLTDYLRHISESDLEPAAKKLNEMGSLLNAVDLSGTSYMQGFLEYREKLKSLTEIFNLWVAAKEPVLAALGDRYPQHYLVLLMNNDEMRMGGGFIGSYAIVELNDGHLTSLDFHDVYELDNRYYLHTEVPVHELRALTDEWRLHDSNISPDFPTSAKHAIRFLDLEGGQSVDGVIAINLSAAQAMLEETGGLTLPSLSQALTAETFPAVISTLVEAKTSGTNNPKEILKELIDAFIESMDDTETKARLALRVLDESHKKQILFYHRNEEIQELISSMDMDASIPRLGSLNQSTDSDGGNNGGKTDFFMPVFTNIGANKTDSYMQTELRHETHIFGDGSIVNAATITRTHTFNPATLAWLKQTLANYGFYSWTGELERILGNDKNHSGLRIYLPEGSEILEVKGDALRDEFQFYYDEEQDISYYYLDQIVEADSSESFTIYYSLPWSFSGEFPEYEFSLFKQPGLKSVTFEKSVTAPDDILLSSEPFSSQTGEETDYFLTGSLAGDIHVKLLYR